MSAPVLRANSELVAQAWLAGVPGLSGQMVATTLPEDNSTWAASGFVTLAVVGGNPAMYTPSRGPVLQVDAWAVSPSSNKPPWGKAANLGELITAACQSAGAERVVTLPGSFPRARVLSTYMVTEFRRAYGDQGDYARYTANLMVKWVDLS